MTWPAAIRSIGLSFAAVAMASDVVVGAQTRLHPVALVVFGGLAVVLALAAVGTERRH